MREILFRGKSKDNGKWIEGYFVVNHLFSATYFICDAESIMYQVIPETVGQYTGLMDKNGKRIFEGDVLKTKYGRLCKVVWFSSPRYCGNDLVPVEDKHKMPSEYDLFQSDNLEVIGNVFDNLELLKGE